MIYSWPAHEWSVSHPRRCAHALLLSLHSGCSTHTRARLVGASPSSRARCAMVARCPSSGTALQTTSRPSSARRATRTDCSPVRYARSERFLQCTAHFLLADLNTDLDKLTQEEGAMQTQWTQDKLVFAIFDETPIFVYRPVIIPFVICSKTLTNEMLRPILFYFALKLVVVPIL